MCGFGWSFSLVFGVGFDFGVGFAFTFDFGGAGSGGAKCTNGAAGINTAGVPLSPLTTLSAACPIDGIDGNDGTAGTAGSDGVGRPAPRPPEEAPAAIKMTPVRVIPRDRANWTRRVGRTQALYEPSTIMRPRSPTPPRIPASAARGAVPHHAFGVFV